MAELTRKQVLKTIEHEAGVAIAYANRIRKIVREAIEEDFPCEKVLQGEFEHLQERVNSLLSCFAHQNGIRIARSLEELEKVSV